MSLSSHNFEVNYYSHHYSNCFFGFYYLVRPNYLYLNTVDSDCLCIKGTHTLDIIFFFFFNFVEVYLKYHKIYLFEVYSSVVFHIFRVVQLLPQPNLEHFNIPRKKPYSYYQLFPSTPSCPHSSRQSLIYFLFMDLPIWHKWNQVVYESIMESCSMRCFVTGFFYLAYAFKLHPCCSKYQYFIPFCSQIIFHSVSIYHILLLHSSADGHSFDLFLLFGCYE